MVSTTALVPALNECKLLKLESLPKADASAALDHWLDAVRRQLQPAQQERLLAAFSRCGLPLYLKLAFEEARGWASSLPPEECLLGDGVQGVIDTLLNRLSLEANHGPLLVSRGLGCLAAARYGLTEDEMLDVLTADGEVWRDFELRAHHTPPERRLPVIVWSRLFLDLEPYLAERSAPGGTVASFYHRQLAEQSEARFLGDEQRQKRHEALAEYFAAQPHWFDAGQTRPNARKAVELIHQQLGAKELDEASATLTDIQFVAAKCGAGLVFDLQTDYSATIALLPEAQPRLEEECRRRKCMERWTREIIEYSRAWSERRDWIEGGLRPEGPEPVLPEIPDSVEPWTEERIAAECERIRNSPERLDALEAIASFVQQENHALRDFGTRPGFVIQHAYDHASAGPVYVRAAAQIKSIPASMLLRQWSRKRRLQPQACALAHLGRAQRLCQERESDTGRTARSVGERGQYAAGMGRGDGGVPADAERAHGLGQ